MTLSVFWAFLGISCTIVVGQEKPGTCPPLPPGEVAPDPADECTTDNDCPGDEKCCPTLTGKACLQPDMPVVPKPQHPSQQIKVVCPDFTAALMHCKGKACPKGFYCYEDICCAHSKPGSCPTTFAGTPAGPPCDCDMDCDSNLKCCGFKNKYRCVFPDKYNSGTVSLVNNKHRPIDNAYPYYVPLQQQQHTTTMDFSHMNNDLANVMSLTNGLDDYEIGKRDAFGVGNFENYYENLNFMEDPQWDYDQWNGNWNHVQELGQDAMGGFDYW